MRSIIRNLRLLPLIIGLAATPGSAAPAAKACPSLSGQWSGYFDGLVSGTWTATFVQSGNQLEATATVSSNGVDIQGVGSAKVSCDDGVARLDGKGSGGGHTGTFNGASDKAGNTLLGNWASGQLQGTWSGNRQKASR